MRLTLSIVSGVHVVDVPLHDPLEAVADADDLDAFELGADRGRADDAVDAGRGTATDEDREFLVLTHQRLLWVTPLPRAGAPGTGSTKGV